MIKDRGHICLGNNEEQSSQTIQESTQGRMKIEPKVSDKK